MERFAIYKALMPNMSCCTT